MKIGMQMRLAKLKDSDWQVGAGGRDSGLWKHDGQGLSSPAARCSGEEDASS